jgi:hypothetical protein
MINFENNLISDNCKDIKICNNELLLNNSFFSSCEDSLSDNSDSEDFYFKPQNFKEMKIGTFIRNTDKLFYFFKYIEIEKFSFEGDRGLIFSNKNFEYKFNIKENIPIIYRYLKPLDKEKTLPSVKKESEYFLYVIFPYPANIINKSLKGSHEITYCKDFLKNLNQHDNFINLDCPYRCIYIPNISYEEMLRFFNLIFHKFYYKIIYEISEEEIKNIEINNYWDYYKEMILKFVENLGNFYLGDFVNSEKYVYSVNLVNLVNLRKEINYNNFSNFKWEIKVKICESIRKNYFIDLFEIYQNFENLKISENNTIFKENSQNNSIFKENSENNSIFNKIPKKKDKNKNEISHPHPHHQFYMKTISITPYSLILKNPTAFHSSRFLRTYFNNDNFIKLEFIENEITNINIKTSYSGNNLSEIFHHLADQGISIAGREYEFFLCTSNSIEAYSFIMIDKNQINPSKDQIYEELGLFKILDKDDLTMSFAKKIARISQHFTSTLNLDLHRFDYNIYKYEISYSIIKDIKNENKIFSDGCGKISPQLLTYASHCLNYSKPSSAIQIRFKGNKGVLVLDENLKNFEIEFTESMVKFDLDPIGDKIFNDLEIIKFSNYSPGYLNLEIIILLLLNGVKPKYILKLAKKSGVGNKNKMVFEFNKFLQKIKKIKDFENFEKNTENSVKNNNFEKSTQNFDKISDNLVKNNYFQKIPENSVKNNNFQKIPQNFQKYSLFHNFTQNKISQLLFKFKFKIKNSALLMGVIDFQGILEENEVFIQLEIPNKNSLQPQTQPKTKIITRSVIVTKNPCLSIHDIQLLICFDKPELRHLKNVIVFSSKGKIPVPDKISNSDLDGDYYFISWDKNLVKIRQNNFEEKLKKVDKIKNKIELTKFIYNPKNSFKKNCVDYFIFYHKNSKIGKVSDVHKNFCNNLLKNWTEENRQYLCDTNKDLIETLAIFHNYEVDFRKSGITTNFNNNSFYSFNNKSLPDFLSKKKSRVNLNIFEFFEKEMDKIREDYCREENIESCIQKLMKFINKSFNFSKKSENFFDKKFLRKFEISENLKNRIINNEISLLHHIQESFFGNLENIHEIMINNFYYSTFPLWYSERDKLNFLDLQNLSKNSKNENLFIIKNLYQENNLCPDYDYDYPYINLTLEEIIQQYNTKIKSLMIENEIIYENDLFYFLDMKSIPYKIKRFKDNHQWIKSVKVEVEKIKMSTIEAIEKLITTITDNDTMTMKISDDINNLILQNQNHSEKIYK